MFPALKWGIVRLSSSNWSRDMTKHKNAIISKFPDFERKIRQILQNSKNWRNNIFTFIDVSLKIFTLQRRTIPHTVGWGRVWPSRFLTCIRYPFLIPHGSDKSCLVLSFLPCHSFPFPYSLMTKNLCGKAKYIDI